MYIEFQLLNDKQDCPVNYVLAMIHTNLIAWAKKYNIEYRTKAFKHTLRVTFDSDQQYTLFSMTWNLSQNKWLEYRLIEPMKTRQP
jgi:hypothetical protein